MIVIYLSVGKLLIWTIQKAELSKKLYTRSKFLTELVSCDFCLGFWIYLGLSILLGYTIFGLVGVWRQALDCIITAVAASFGMHLFSIGWTVKFGVTYLE